MKNREKIGIIIIIILLILSIILGRYLYKEKNKTVQVVENQYNMAFFQLIDYVQNMQNYLAKSLISSTHQHGAKTLTEVWRESNLAAAYLAELPLSTETLAKTEKFLNQVSDYSFSLSRKNIYNEDLTDEDFDNLGNLYDYSVELVNTLTQLSDELQNNTITWLDLESKGSGAFTQEVDNISQDSFSNLGESFEKYEGLIYDGAYSEHLTSEEKKGLTGEDISEESAKNIASNFFENNNIKEINSNGLVERGEIPAYDFNIVLNENERQANISISRKGGHIILMNGDRVVEEEKISQNEANEIGKKFLEEKGFPNMKETYYLKQGGIVTINYAYIQDDITIYPDLIKVKVALDNGEILGMESTGYLNSHFERSLSQAKISIEEAKLKLNPDIEIKSQGTAIIPTEWKTELLCYEFKGTVKDRDFLVYINVENGREEDVLVIINTPNGTLTS